jgi:hypothetical protein
MPRRETDNPGPERQSSWDSWKLDDAWDPDDEYGTTDSDGTAPWERRKKDEETW